MKSYRESLRQNLAKRGVTHRNSSVKKCVSFFQSGMGIVAFSKKAGLPTMTLHQWVSAFKAASPAIADSSMTKDEKTRALEEEVAELKRALGQAAQERDTARARAPAWETMVDVAEEMFGIEIRKKADTKQ